MGQAKNNFYMKHHAQMNAARTELRSAQSSRLQKPVVLEGEPVTPLRLLGTQRTQYTHRKNRESKKVKAEI